MNGEAERRIRAAALAFAGELVAALEASESRQEGPEELLTIAQVSDRCGGIARSTIYRLIASGQLESRKIGRRRLVPASSIAVLGR